MNIQKEKFIQTYQQLLLPIADEILKYPNYQDLYGPHIPGVGDNYWNLKNHPKIAFVGRDVGEGQLIGNGFENLRSYIEFYSKAINDCEILDWGINNQNTFAFFVVSLLSKVFNKSVDEIVQKPETDILKSFVWANTNSTWNYQSWNNADKTMSYDTWLEILKLNGSFDSLKLLIEATSPNIVIITHWTAHSNYFKNVRLIDILKSKHLAIYSDENSETLIIHINHPRNFFKDYGKGGNYVSRKIEEFYPSIENIIYKFQS